MLRSRSSLSMTSPTKHENTRNIPQKKTTGSLPKKSLNGIFLSICLLSFIVTIIHSLAHSIKAGMKNDTKVFLKKQSNVRKMGERVHITMKSTLGIPHKLSDQDLAQKKNGSKISLIISHCNLPIDWIPGYIGDNYNIQDITIYSKCGMEVEGIDKLKSVGKPKIIRLVNVGRCDHSYAHWIAEHYQSIVRDKDQDSIAFFLKDNNYHQSVYRPFDEVFTFASELGFGCALKPIWCDCPEGHHQCEPNNGMMLHNKTEVDSFEMRHRHVRLGRDDGSVDTFVSEEYPTLKTWKDSMGLVTANSQTIPVCYGGMFAVKQERVLDQSEESWKRVKESLEREDNLVEGHYAERLWASILYGNDKKYAEAVDNFVLPHINQTSRCIGRPGMILVPKGTSAELLNKF